MRAILSLCFAWAIVVCVTPGLADHFQSQAIVARTGDGDLPPTDRQTHQVACRRGDRPVISANLDPAIASRTDRVSSGTTIEAGFITYCG